MGVGATVLSALWMRLFVKLKKGKESGEATLVKQVADADRSKITYQARI